MSNENNGGSDLDIFEGLGKTGSARTSAVPPPPSVSKAPMAGSVVPPPPSVSKAPVASAADVASPDSKRPAALTPPSPESLASPPSTAPAVPATTASLPAAAFPNGRKSGPPSSTSLRAVSSRPPFPPPARSSLPPLGLPSNSSPPAATRASATPAAIEESSSDVTAPQHMDPQRAKAAIEASEAQISKTNGAAKLEMAKVPMEWDDDDAATQIFDKDVPELETSKIEPPKKDSVRAGLLPASASNRPSAPPVPGTPSAPPSMLSAAFGALDSNGRPSQTSASAPPPPPSLRPSARPASVPPPPPGQTTTAPMNMPPARPASVPPPASTLASGFPAGVPSSGFPSAGHPSSPMPALPPVPSVPSVPPSALGATPPSSYAPSAPPSRALEQTALVPRAPSSRVGMWLGLAAVGLLFGVGAYWMMTPRAGTLAVNVADAKGGAVSQLKIFVDGNAQCESAPCTVGELSAGVHEVRVEAPGYQKPAARAVTIEGKGATVDFTLVSLGGATVASSTGLRVTSKQAGVRLSLDGKLLGTLPQELHDVAPGEHKLQFSAGERYGTVERTVTVSGTELTDVGDVVLPVVKGKATIQLGTPSAKVYLVSGSNRREVPQFPISIELDPREHWQLEAKKDGFADYVLPIGFEDGDAEKNIVVTLEPKSAASTARAATATPAPAAPTPAPARTPTPSKAPATETAAATETPKKTAAAATGEAFLNINSLPASTVVLDGKPLGPTPRVKVPVKPGEHTVLFVNAEQSLKKTITVTVGNGETKPAFAKLRD